MTDVTAADTKRKVERVAEHAWLDAAGVQVKEIEKAAQISYRTKADGVAPFVYNVAAAPAEVLRMLALFGARTVATNSASANRNAAEPTGVSDMDAVIARFAALTGDDWDNRESARGPRYNLDMLADAIVAVYADTGKKVKRTMIAERLAGDEAFYAGMIANEAIKAKYAALKAVAAGPQALPDL